MDEYLLEIVKALIRIGEAGIPAVPEIRRRRKITILPRNLEHARFLAKELSAAELKDLIRGLVLYGRVERFRTGGSASPIPPIYQEFCKRYPEQEPELTGWIVDNRVNPYDPFGTIAFPNVRSIEQLAQEQDKRARRRRVNEAADVQRYEEHLIEVSEDATQKLPNAVRRGDVKAVKALLGKGADRQKAEGDVGSLVRLAEQHNREGMAAYLSTHDQEFSTNPGTPRE